MRSEEGKPHRGSEQEVIREESLNHQRSAAHTREDVTKSQKKQEQERPGTEPSRRRSSQKGETAGQTRQPGIHLGTPEKERGRGRKGREQEPPGTEAIGSKNPKEQRKFVRSKNPAPPQREKDNRSMTQDHGGKKGEKDDLAEVGWLSQASRTRERTEQRKAEFLEDRKMQDGRESGQTRDREKRDWSPVPPGYKPAVRQPGTSLGRADQGHAGREYPQNFNNQENQGSEQKSWYCPEQERKVGLEGPPGVTLPRQDYQGDQGHRGTDGAPPQWQRGINGAIGIPEKEQDSQTQPKKTPEDTRQACTRL